MVYLKQHPWEKLQESLVKTGGKSLKIPQGGNGYLLDPSARQDPLFLWAIPVTAVSRGAWQDEWRMKEQLALLPATDKAVWAQKGNLFICAGALHQTQIHWGGTEWWEKSKSGSNLQVSVPHQHLSIQSRTELREAARFPARCPLYSVCAWAAPCP